ncbi:hypothetical protein PybrP1_003876 [[Pythium] brassicae (nom. inval.)]|nr:hypothetical protein PybrP1_003876 [[Pythium] brassicae (nom. inval.)]
MALRPGSVEPSPRGGATLTQVDDGSVYLIGGANREGICFGDVHRFSLESREWSRLTLSSTTDAFPARSGHSAVALGRCIVVFGGLSPATGEVFNDVHVFDIHSCKWSRAEIADGEVPMPRNAHAAVLLPASPAAAAHHRMLVFGGSSPDDGAFEDAFVLQIPLGYVTAAGNEDREPLRWERVDGGRNRDGTICTDMALLDPHSWQWQLVPICEWNRCSHVAGLVGGALVSFGGFDGGALRDDIWVYRDDAESWERATIVYEPGSVDNNSDTHKVEGGPETAILLSLERFGHAGCTVELRASAAGASGKVERRIALLVFGGMNASTDLNDLLMVAQCQRRT